VAGLQLEPGLTDRLVADTRTGDALPLLAFTLRELWERYGRDGDLTLTEYEHLGGLEGSVQRAADAVLDARTLSPDEKEALRIAFLRMCRINEEGQHARIVACWDSMPPASREVLHRFVEARLLVSGKESGRIEVAHEALLRVWPLLRGWLEQSREFLLGRQQLEEDLAQWQGRDDPGELGRERAGGRDRFPQPADPEGGVEARCAGRKRRCPPKGRPGGSL
jgi:hypothetical protein